MCRRTDDNAGMPERAPTDLVTGAFGYTGSRIAQRLITRGRNVVTLTRRESGRHPLSGDIKRLAYDFTPDALVQALSGVDTLYVTYWMRFPRGEKTWAEVVTNIGRLAHAAQVAGVRRIVYISVSNAGHDSSTAYFRAKAAAEDGVRSAARGSGLSYAIVRPTLLYGPHDILLNNMAWTLRRLPLFGIPGRGDYRVQPVLVDDVADLCVEVAQQDVDRETDAAGPEAFTFDELVRAVRDAVGSRARLVHMPWPLVLAGSGLIGLLVHDVVLTRDEIRELTEGLLTSAQPPTCPTRLTDWISANGEQMGRRYSSELARNFRPFARRPS